MSPPTTAPTTPPAQFGVLAVGGAATPPAERGLGDAVAWYRAVSGGAWAPCPVPLPPVRLEHAPARYAAARGLSARGPNSRDLVAAAVALMTPEARARLAAAGGRLALLVPPGFRAHVWYPARGGLALGNSAWCRRFAVIPAAAPLGTVAHELGHLLAGWPEGDPSAGGHCLMALGGLRGEGRDPAPPAAPLLLAAGWRRALRPGPALRVTDLAALPHHVATLDWRYHRIVAETRDGRLLAWAGAPARPRLLAALPVARRGDSPVLGLLAPSLRRLPAARDAVA